MEDKKKNETKKTDENKKKETVLDKLIKNSGNPLT